MKSQPGRVFCLRCPFKKSLKTILVIQKAITFPHTRVYLAVCLYHCLYVCLSDSGELLMSVNQSVSQSVCQLVSQSVSQLVSQSVMDIYLFIKFKEIDREED